MKSSTALFAALWLASPASWSQTLVGEHEAGLAQLLMSWDAGSEDCGAPDEKTIEVRYYDRDTVVLRQNPCVDPEANLLYLLIGGQRSVLIDSGAVDGQFGAATADFVREILASRGVGGRPLLVVHTHGHQDHRAGDEWFARQPDTQVVPFESKPLRAFLGFKDWPNDTAQIDLGNRVVDLIPTPGHHQDHIVFYDRNTRLLISGDFLLPGRLLVEDIDAYRASARRVADFAGSHPVSHVLGAHIELDSAGNPYPGGATHHPDERTLPLSTADLLALPGALDDFNGFYSRHPNYFVVNPVHNLVALAGGLVLAIVLVIWIVRRLWKRRRAPV